MTVVVDASLAVKWVVPQVLTEEALALWDIWEGDAERVTAPHLFRSEVTNVMRQYIRRGTLTPFDAAEVLEELLATVSSVEPAGIYARALTIANDHQLGSTYDAVYLALAESQQCEFWTADAKFARAVGDRFQQVRLLAEPLES